MARKNHRNLNQSYLPTLDSDKGPAVETICDGLQRPCTKRIESVHLMKPFSGLYRYMMKHKVDIRALKVKPCIAW